MRVSEAFPSKYLKVEDLNDEDMTLTIKDVTSEMLGQGAEAQRKLVVHFRECEKGLACNKTNAGVIAKLYGNDTDGWLGKRITLWPNHDVEFKGEIVSAIRVRSKTPGGGGRPALRSIASRTMAPIVLRIADGRHGKSRRKIGVSQRGQQRVSHARARSRSYSLAGRRLRRSKRRSALPA